MMTRMKKIIEVAAVCVFVLLAAGGCANPEREGTKALENGQYEEALEQFQKASESEDKEKAAEGFRGQGIAYYEMEDYTSALDAFQKAVDNGAEQTVQLYNLMGICGMRTGDYEGALESFQAGLALIDAASDEEAADGDMIREMKYNEIICYEQLADWENARQKAEEYLSEYPDDEAVQREMDFLKTR